MKDLLGGGVEAVEIETIVLPESNGNIDPSTEDWTADSIVATYAKIETSLEAFVRSEPNAHLRFIVPERA